MAGLSQDEVAEVTDRAVVLDTDRRIVGLAGWLSASIRSAGARTPYLRTGARSAVSYPLEVMLTQSRLTWVVATDNQFYNGLTGTPLAWNGDDFVPSGDQPSATARQTADASGALRIEVTALWQPTEELVLGAPFEIICEVMTGGQPSGWGEAEPISRDWSSRALTSLARSRSPRSTVVTLLAGSGPSATTGLSMIDRVRSGVAIKQRVSIPMDRPPTSNAVKSLAAAMASQSVRSMTMLWQPGVGSTRLPTPIPWPRPLGILVGPETTLRVGAEFVAAAPAAGTFFGDAGTRSWWCEFSANDRDAAQSLDAVLAHFAPGAGQLPALASQP